jgi:hypothetical protein
VERPTASRTVILAQNYPDPFPTSTTITFALASSTFVQLEVFDSRGALVSQLLNERRAGGEHSIRFDASQLATGVYYYHLKAGEEVISRSMMHTR